MHNTEYNNHNSVLNLTLHTAVNPTDYSAKQLINVTKLYPKLLGKKYSLVIVLSLRNKFLHKFGKTIGHIKVKILPVLFLSPNDTFTADCNAARC